MLRYWLPAAGLLFFGLNAMSMNPELVKDTIVHLEEACALGEEEIALLSELEGEQNPQVALHQARFQRLLEKLNACKSNLTLLASRNCEEEEIAMRGDHFPFNIDKAKIATGCDWVIRIAGLLWALEFFCGMIF